MGKFKLTCPVGCSVNNLKFQQFINEVIVTSIIVWYQNYEVDLYLMTKIFTFVECTGRKTTEMVWQFM